MIKLKKEEFFEGFDGYAVLCAPISDFVTDKSNSKNIFLRFSKLIFSHKKLFIIAIIVRLNHFCKILGLSLNLTY